MKRSNFHACAYCGHVIKLGVEPLPLVLDIRNPDTQFRVKLMWHDPGCSDSDPHHLALADAFVANDKQKLFEAYKAILARWRSHGPAVMERIAKVLQDTNEKGYSARTEALWGLPALVPSYRRPR